MAALVLSTGVVSVPARAATGAAPTVSVGADQVVNQGDTVFLRGRVSDDGLPDPSMITKSWSVVSGPGEVTFGRNGEAHTSADFSDVGDYVLRLTAFDGGGSGSDELTVTVRSAPATTINVPADYPTIQQALDAAPERALVLVAPGIYHENLYIPHTLTLASTYYTTGDPAMVEQTVISAVDSEAETVITSSTVEADTRIVGFTVRDGKDGIKVRGAGVVEHNLLTSLGTDAVELTTGGTAGLVQHNVMRGNGDDGVDVNEASAVIVDNLIEGNDGDGIEMRVKDVTAPIDEVIIRGNRIFDNIDDGLQIIDDDSAAPSTPTESATLFTIDRNIIARNVQAGLGLMDQGDTSEDYRGASVVERIVVTNNTFVGNNHGITGGDNLVAVNNIFSGHAVAALKNVDGGSEAAYNQFFDNGAPNSSSNVDPATSYVGDPQLDADFAPLAGSPVIDAGTATYALAGGEPVVAISGYDGAAPDLGAVETVGGTGGNLRPVVDAGADVSVQLPDEASLVGEVSDDGLPEGGSLSVLWEKASGPGVVSFGDAASAVTSAGFSEPGSYVLRLTASDGELSGSDTVVVSVAPEGGAVVTAESRPAASTDDAEERLSGSVSLTSSDLELVTDGSTVQTVGVRFPGLEVPQGASVVGAWIQFQADEVSTGAADLRVAVQDADDAAGFTNSGQDVSGRQRFGSVAWSPPEWSATGARGAAQRTPDLSGLVQQVVSRPGWSSGNAMAFVVTGSGTRTAEAFDGEGAVTVLHVEYVMGDPGEPVNQRPVVDAGADLSVQLPDEVSLVGDVSDDGLPEGGSVSVLWEKASGPGAVTLSDAASVVTSAGFSEPGSYVLRLTASDGELSGSDTVAVSVAPEDGAVVVAESRPAASTDDAEERASGAVSLNSSDLELVTDGSRDQVVGMRFPSLAVPQGASVVGAWIQFQADEVSTGGADLRVAVQDADDAAGFTNSGQDVSARQRFGAVAWSPPEWSATGARGAAQQTPDLSALVQQVVSRPGWSSGNAMAFVVTGSGTRTAEAFDGEGAVTVLHVEYTVGEPGNLRPVVDAGADVSVQLPDEASLVGDVSDDGLPEGGSVSVLWEKASGPGAVSFSDASSLVTSAGFSEPGSYVLRLTASDGELSGSDTVVVSVAPEGGAVVAAESRPAASTDDAEERSSGSVSLNSSDLELVTDGSREQVVGIRFPSLAVPQGASVVGAWIQFQADEVSTGAADLEVAVQDADDAVGFTNGSQDVSGRQRFGSVPWSPPEWTSRGARGAAQRTPDLSGLVQQVVSRPGWSSGNAMAFVVTGTGTRTAEAFDGEGAVTVLHVEYVMP